MGLGGGPGPVGQKTRKRQKIHPAKDYSKVQKFVQNLSIKTFFNVIELKRKFMIFNRNCSICNQYIFSCNYIKTGRRNPAKEQSISY